MTPSRDYCLWTQERIEPFVDGELRGEELEAFERHLASCEPCREELARAATLVSELRALPPRRCPDRVLEEAAARAGAYEHGAGETQFERLRRRIGAFLALRPRPVMAVVVIVLVAAVFIVQKYERLRTIRIAEQPAELVASEEELKAARMNVALAFEYVSRYTSSAAETSVRRGACSRMMKTICESVVKPMIPFPIRK